MIPTPSLATTLRPYQRDGADALHAAILAGGNPLYVAGTGSGKTRTVAAVVQELDLPTIWLVHRKELVEQAYRQLRALGLNVGYAMAGRPLYRSRQILVGTFGTVRRRDIGQRRLVIADEAHRIVAKTHHGCLSAFTDARVAGCTATPYRLDGRGLGGVFDTLVEAPREEELIRGGFLMEPKAFAPPPVALAGVDVRAGDYARGQLARIVDKPKLIGDAIETWKKHACAGGGAGGGGMGPGGYLTIAFACSVEHSKHLAAAWREAGVSAAHADADTPADERDRLVAAFARREITVLCNVELFTEGFDVPGVECVSINRPTKSLGLHRQMIGRATRVLPGKRYPIVLDHAGNLHRHGRITRHLTYSLDAGVQPDDAGSGLRTCPRCFRMVLAGRTRCPECGLEFATVQRDRMPETVDGELEEYREGAGTADAPPPSRPPATWEEKEKYFREINEEAQERGWKQGAVFHRFKARFGHYPVIVCVGSSGVGSGVDGVYRLATPESDDPTKAAALAKWTAEAADKGFKAGFAAARFKELFGGWPSARIKEMAGVGTGGRREAMA